MKIDRRTKVYRQLREKFREAHKTLDRAGDEIKTQIFLAVKRETDAQETHSTSSSRHAELPEPRGRD